MAKEPLKTDERQKLLEAGLKSLGISANKVLRGDQLGNKHKNYIPTGQTEIDLALGDIPGFAEGSIVELIGESASGKTYLALKTAAQAQNKGKRVAFFNIENSFYEPRAVAIGVQTRNEDLFELWENVGSGEKWGELAKYLASTGDYGLIVIDSVTAMIPSADYDKSLENEAKIGAHARMCGRLTQKLTEICGDSKTIVILINQFRYGTSTQGQLIKKSTGGESIGYYAHTRLTFSKIGGANGVVYSAEKEVIGGRSRVRVLKNRYGEPDALIEFPIYFSAVESDPIIEFVMRAKNKNHEYIKEVRKVYKYVTEDGEVIESKDIKEFILKLQNTPAPSKKTRGDNSKTAFEYICGRVKFSDSMVEKLNNKLTIIDTDYDISENEKGLSDFSTQEIEDMI